MGRKSSSGNKGAVARVIFMMFVWVFYLLFALACISYSPSDPPSAMVVNFGGVVKYHNWIGSVGAHLAYAAMTGVGPGIFAAIVLVGWAMVLWTKGDGISQLPLRVIGGALLVAVVSTLFNMFGSAGVDGVTGGVRAGGM